MKGNVAISTRYPRAWAEGEEPVRIYLGIYDIAKFMGWSRSWASLRMNDRSLPFADGPDINGLPTWRRGTIIAWAYLMNWLPSAHILEAQSFLASKNGKAALERGFVESTRYKAERAKRKALEEKGRDGLMSISERMAMG